MQLHTLVYCSQAVRGIERRDLEQIARAAQRFNTRNNISGMLLYSNDMFIQVLEGPLPMLEHLYERKIRLDRRHFDLERLMINPVKERRFGEWAMGVLDASRSARLDREKLRFICDQAHNDPAAAGRAALTVLKIFRKDLGPEGTQAAA